MREIKFRAWNKMMKAMLHFEKPKAIADDEDRYGMFLPVVEGKIYIGGEYEVMGYTGLHDWNGKEIYEGDVVCITPTAGLEEPYNGEVVWDEERAGFRVDCGFDFMDFIILLETGCNIEVIGNIYTSPELLKSR
jgi:uncharacterized phage protein (TIGR01671 family)